jgi:Na+-driven multidrug efflux pump
MIGINQGSQPIIGFNYGAKNYERAKEALKWAVIYSVIICSFGFAIVQAFSPYLIMVFNDDAELISVGAIGLRIFLFAIPVVGFQIPAANFFQSIGRAKMSIFLTLLKQVILLMPLYFLLPLIFGLLGIWIANAATDVISTLITFFVLRREFKRWN